MNSFTISSSFPPSSEFPWKIRNDRMAEVITRANASSGSATRYSTHKSSSIFKKINCVTNLRTASPALNSNLRNFLLRLFLLRFRDFLLRLRGSASGLSCGRFRADISCPARKSACQISLQHTLPPMLSFCAQLLFLHTLPAGQGGQFRGTVHVQYSTEKMLCLLAQVRIDS